ncbi:MAG: TfoX/Sxy family DNA transformation protein [Deltaproteobacteria bacterium]|nr:TfoX/Sxy family DNA transformation protein [Deltaproteobacteria bacterium]
MSELPNIGPIFEPLLGEYGIASPEELRSLGSIETCRRLQLRGEVCFFHNSGQAARIK